MPNMSSSTLKNILTNPARTYLWDILIPNVIGGGDASLLQVRAQSSSIPTRGIGTGITIPYKQTAGVKYPGKSTLDHSWDVTFIEGEDRKVFDAINGWYQQVVNLQSGISAGDENIKTDILITLISTKGTIYQKMKLQGCYVEKIGAVTLDYSDEGTIKYTVTFSFDNVIDTN